MNDRERDKLRCFKDDAIMVPIKGHPGWIRCSVCDFMTKLVRYDAASVRRDFDDMHAERLASEVGDDALYPNGHMAPKGHKKGGGSKSGRKRSKPGDKKPAPKWTLV